MSTTHTPQAPDVANTQEMVVIHRIFRRGFPQLADLIRRTAPGDVRRAAPIGEHAEFVLDGLHNHHATEDENIWPRLLERVAPGADLIGRMEAQHHVVAEHIEQARLLLPKWKAAPDAASGAELADTLHRLGEALGRHLDEEEAEILPLIRTHITGAEWREFGKRAFDKFPDSAKLIALGQMLEVADPREAAMFFGTLPVPVRLIWRLAGRRRYARYIRRVRGRDGR
ncbi:hemerythrin domain-containing protein [Planotetraspora kaengkrachanensis]|uniref:Hemerythrin-like domain-containing protein n=1 Tax=Planotetraspora kaengkrachanensis TaxID=575193 RepID=A0A8J3PWG2_9ACTN|nr:hemerythrin domain-containing protein [Planotetraspora kaengkrachanensis]GIG82280.1 hypothetical protein Pka01_54070 [Planotetraspora kaengkrachanensis]